MEHECVILADSPGALVELCGISILERLLRTLQRCGLRRAAVLSATPELIETHLARPSWARDQLRVTVHARPAGEVTAQQIAALVPESAHLVLVVRGDSVFDNRLLPLLVKQTAGAVLVEAGALCGAFLLPRDWLSAQPGSLEKAVAGGLPGRALAPLDLTDIPWYHPSLRRNMKPFWFPAPGAAQTAQAESLLLDSIQKGSQDLPAHVHAPLERFLVSHLCWTRIRPNQITMVWAAAALAATVLFATGHLLWGIGLALVIGILDGLDGKLARLKVETTKGGRLEHQVDNFLEIAWPTALAFHFYVSGQLPNAVVYLGILVAAEILDGIGKLGVYSAAEQSLQEPRRIDRIVRFFGGRRNVFVWVLIVCVVLGVPAKALIVMACWESVTAIFDLPHAAWAQFRLRRRRRPVQANVLV